MGALYDSAYFEVRYALRFVLTKDISTEGASDSVTSAQIFEEPVHNLSLSLPFCSCNRQSSNGVAPWLGLRVEVTQGKVSCQLELKL
jgi:hypothetical protein